MINLKLYLYKAKLVRVKDGDTIEAIIDFGFNRFSKEAIRFYGVDAYEISGSTAHPLGKVGKQFIIDSFTKYGDEFILQSHKDSLDLYVRVLGTIYWPDKTNEGDMYINLNQSLVASGLVKGSPLPVTQTYAYGSIA